MWCAAVYKNKKLFPNFYFILKYLVSFFFFERKETKSTYYHGTSYVLSFLEEQTYMFTSKIGIQCMDKWPSTSIAFFKVLHNKFNNNHSELGIILKHESILNANIKAERTACK